MFAAYVFSLVLSGTLLAVSVFSDFLDADTPDLDVDVDVDTELDGSDAARILSVRGLLYFLFGFGAVGAALSLVWSGGHPAMTAGVAGLGGLGSGVLATAVFGYLKRSESGDVADEGAFIGLPGRMVVPISAQGIGQVRVQRHNGTVDLVALPFGDPQGDPTQWREVVVIEMKNGKALVAPAEEKLLSG